MGGALFSYRDPSHATGRSVPVKVSTMPVLEIEGLRKSFRSPEGETTTIVDVGSFVMESAQQIGLRGSSGSGKTTFLHLIAGILQADAGEIRIAGESITTD